MRLSRRELTERVIELNNRINLLYINKELEEYWLYATKTLGCFYVKREWERGYIFYWNIEKYNEWFDWYKQWVEDWTIIVELNEEETEKVQENKKKSKSK